MLQNDPGNEHLNKVDENGWELNRRRKKLRECSRSEKRKLGE